MLPLFQDEKLISETINRFDGIILSGGSDIDPKYYNQINSGKSLEINSFRDESEEKIVRVLIESDIPVLGICRGMQVMNVFCGGSLWQDFASQLELTEPHCTKDENGSTHHPVTVSGWLKDLLKEERIMTNSYHHQSVKEPGRDLVICARSDDGIAEAMVHTALPYFRAVQWHPEVDPDGYSKKIFEEFFSACR